MFLIKKINAGALQYVIFISVIILLLLTSFISLNYLQNTFKNQSQNFKELVEMSDNGIYFAANNSMGYDEEIELSFSEREQLQTTVYKKHWGIFDILTTKSTIKNDLFSKTALLGGSYRNKPVLYLKDNNRALIVVGTTKIEGNAYLPKQKVRSGYIAGKSYYNSQFIYGEILKSNKELPEIINRNYLKQFLKNPIPFDASFFLLDVGMKKLNSFENNIEVYRSNQLVRLSDISLTGNIIVQSDTLIRVSKNCLLKDVLLVAPKIEISDGVIGNFQAFASEEILVGKNCILNYPSALTLYGENSNNNIRIDENTKVQGVISFLTDAKENSSLPQIILEKNVTVDGEVYCDKNIDTEAVINGSVYTSNFVAVQFGSRYQNHVFNSQMKSSNLPIQYAGLQFKGKKQTIAKWMY